MSIARNLKTFLDENRVRYHVLKHHEEFTAQEIAHALHVPGKELAKVVMVKADGQLVMAVLPASFRVDLDKLAGVVAAERAELATENEFKGYFPDCEPGAMPPFGNLYHLPVYVDRTLAEDDQIVFEAGTHHEAIKLDYLDFERLAQPVEADFCRRTP